MTAESKERKPRKSVAFSEGTTIVDENGDVTENNETSDKTTAEAHSTPGMLSLLHLPDLRRRQLSTSLSPLVPNPTLTLWPSLRYGR